MKRMLLALLLVIPLSTSGCLKVSSVAGRQPSCSNPASTGSSRPRAITVLLDCTASFDSFDEARTKIATELVRVLKGGDHVYVIRIRNYGFQDRDLVVNETVPVSQRTIALEIAQAKRKIYREVLAIQPLLDERGTDICGAIYQAGDILEKHEGCERWLIICSDMEQDTVRKVTSNLPAGTHVLCLYVSHADGEIKHYEEKCQRWQSDLENAGADSVQLLDVAASKSLAFFSGT